MTGRISERQVSIGDVVVANTTPLTRIVTLDPIWFAFEGAESFYLKYCARITSGQRRSSRYAANPVEVQLADETGYPYHGHMAFVDNAIDTHSGTIKAHAELPNPDGFLTPGMFGRARLLGSGPYQAMLIPDEAIVTDQTRRLVYVVGKDGVVAQRPVETGPLVIGLRVVKSGLSASDSVVLDGLASLQPGMQVDASIVQIKPSAADTSPRRRRSRRRLPPKPRRVSAMKFPHFFIERPIFASVLSILIVVFGIVAYPDLPVAQYPEIAPPTVVVSANYPGATAETLAETVATPLEESINGVEDMLYMSSSSTGDGVAHDHRHVRAGHECRPGAGAGAEPRRDRRAAPAGRGAPDRRHRWPRIRRTCCWWRRSSRPTARCRSNTCRTTRRFSSWTASAAFLASAARGCSAGATTTCASGSIPVAPQSVNLTVDEVVAAVRGAECAGRGRRGRPTALQPGRHRLSARHPGQGPAARRRRISATSSSSATIRGA